jgi:hypothetical protein
MWACEGCRSNTGQCHCYVLALTISLTCSNVDCTVLKMSAWQKEIIPYLMTRRIFFFWVTSPKINLQSCSQNPSRCGILIQRKHLVNCRVNLVTFKAEKEYLKFWCTYCASCTVYYPDQCFIDCIFLISYNDRLCKHFDLLILLIL